LDPKEIADQITFDNCHLVAKAIVENSSTVAKAFYYELLAQMSIDENKKR
jgi:hypothetical protein